MVVVMRGDNCYSHPMGSTAANLSAPRPAIGAPAARDLASGEGWSVSEISCGLGPQDRPFEERHDRVTIAAVVAGSFLYRSDSGTALLYPGAFLLGNAGSCYECGHDHGVGDRCVAFHFAPSFFEGIASAITGSSRFRFPTGMLPPLRRLTARGVEMEIVATDKNPLATEELAIRLVEAVLSAASGVPSASATPSTRDRRRVSDVLRYVEECADRPLGLAELADVARLSKYHFLRSFRRTVGITPYQFLLSLRMRRAALALSTTSMSVAAIAFDCGFGDLSTFNARFRDVFGTSPHSLRKLWKPSSASAFLH
jgi:AraC family transcriptional regulator